MMWLRIAMRLATSLTAGGHDDDALLVLADLKDTVQVGSLKEDYSKHTF